MNTNDILNIIHKNAKVDMEFFEEPFSEIKKLLKYYSLNLSNKERYKYDTDAVYFYYYDETISKISDLKERRDLAERGDIMTSIWTLLTYYLNLNDNKILCKNKVNIDKILNHKRSDEIFTLLIYLSKHYSTRGNILLLPNTKNSYNKRGLNPEKFFKSEDKIDQFLYYCFNDKSLFEYFDNELDNLNSWIYSECLECMFTPDLFRYSLIDIENKKAKINVEKDEIKIENLQSLINDNSRIKTYKYKDFHDKDWKEYINRLNKIIAYRNSMNIKSHLPFTWNNNIIME